VVEAAISGEYERVIAPVDPAAVIVTTASGGELAGCVVTFNSPCSIKPPRYAVWLSHRNHTYHVALRADTLLVHMLTHEDLPMAEFFGGVSGMREDKFSKIPWTDYDGLPLLNVSGGWLRGRVLSRIPTDGDHTCFVLSPTAAGGAGGNGQQLRMSDLSHITPGQPAGEPG
jgi:flavin reductase (DIM6/NTAB) family NADH-FMN oxidoreductase RutF